MDHLCLALTGQDTANQSRTPNNDSSFRDQPGRSGRAIPLSIGLGSTGSWRLATPRSPHRQSHRRSLKGTWSTRQTAVGVMAMPDVQGRPNLKGEGMTESFSSPAPRLEGETKRKMEFMTAAEIAESMPEE